jgi:hypothetical protein
MSRVAPFPLAGEDPQADPSLPGWTWRDPEYFAVEMERLNDGALLRSTANQLRGAGAGDRLRQRCR